MEERIHVASQREGSTERTPGRLDDRRRLQWTVEDFVDQQVPNAA